MTVTQSNLSGHDLPEIDWERVRHALAADYPQAPGTGGPDRHTSWLTTTNPDGTHVRPVGMVQVDGDGLTAEFSAPSAGPSAMVAVQGRTDDRLRIRHRRTGRCHQIRGECR